MAQSFGITKHPVGTCDSLWYVGNQALSLSKAADAGLGGLSVRRLEYSRLRDQTRWPMLGQDSERLGLL